MLRAVVLSLVLLIGIGMLIPLATEYVEAGPRKIRKYSKNKKSVRKYSKRWWRSYNRRKKARRARARRVRQSRARRARRARVRRASARRARMRRARVRRTRARRARVRRVRRARVRRANIRRARVRRARLRQTKRTRVNRTRRAATPRSTTQRQTTVAVTNPQVRIDVETAPETRSIIAAQVRAVAPAEVRSAQSSPAPNRQSVIPNPVGNYPVEDLIQPLPTFIQPTAAAQQPAQPVVRPVVQPVRETGAVAQGELQFGVTSPSGGRIGAAAISVIGPAVTEQNVYNRRVQTVGGVTTTTLRRTVIDQMIRENGWVVNDYQKEIAGQDVYVVVAQAPGANNEVENRMYYFTESGGRIYSVATKGPERDAELLEEESEKVVSSFRRGNAPNAQVAENRQAAPEANRTFIGMGNRASNN